MTKSPNRLSVIDFIVQVLVRYERELNRNIVKLERIVSELARNEEKS